MYKDLIKRIRNVSMEFGQLDHVSVLLLEAADAIEALSKMETATQWIPVTDKEHIPNTDHGVVGYFGGGAFNQLRWYDFVTTLSDGKIVGESTERDVINEHCIAVCKLPEPPKEG